jgi:hypothetical protein
MGIWRFGNEAVMTCLNVTTQHLFGVIEKNHTKLLSQPSKIKTKCETFQMRRCSEEYAAVKFRNLTT